MFIALDDFVLHLGDVRGGTLHVIIDPSSTHRTQGILSLQTNLDTQMVVCLK